MKSRIFTAVFIAVGMSGCGKPPADGVATHGRYVGIGIYSAGGLWSKIVGAGRPTDTASAKLGDDEQVIVVVDSLTGEVRQCGNLTGYCVGMNPWTKPLTTLQNAPVGLTVHAVDQTHAPSAITPAPGR